MSVKFVSLNIEGSKHLASRILPFFQKNPADIYCFMELFAHDLPIIETALGIKIFFAPMANCRGTKEKMGADGLLGVGIGTGQDVVVHMNESKIAYYVGRPDSIPDYTPDEDTSNHPNVFNRAVLSQLLGKEGKSYRIVTTHFTWAANGGSNPEQVRDLSVMMKILDSFPDFIFAGDLNAPRGKEVFDQLAAKYQDEIPAHFDSSIDGELHRAGNLPLMVDALFVKGEYKISGAHLQTGLSDHKAILANIL